MKQLLKITIHSLVALSVAGTSLFLQGQPMKKSAPGKNVKQKTMKKAGKPEKVVQQDPEKLEPAKNIPPRPKKVPPPPPAKAGKRSPKGAALRAPTLPHIPKMMPSNVRHVAKRRPSIPPRPRTLPQPPAGANKRFVAPKRPQLKLSAIGSLKKKNLILSQKRDRYRALAIELKEENKKLAQNLTQLNQELQATNA